jgi:superfamily II DNA/RNA helicase
VIDEFSFFDIDVLYDLVASLPKTDSLRFIIAGTVFTKASMEYFPKFLRSPLLVPHMPAPPSRAKQIKFLEHLGHVRMDFDSADSAFHGLLNLLPTSTQTLIICSGCQEADALGEKCRSEELTVSVVHGSMDFHTRTTVLQELRTGCSRVLITTNGFVPGLDVQQVSLVVFWHVPSSPFVYLHVAGRTGRFGREGGVVTFVHGYERENDRVLKEVEEFVGPIRKK